MNLKEMRERLEALLAEVKSLEAADLTDEQAAELDAKLDEVAELKADIAKAEKREAVRARASETLANIPAQRRTQPEQPRQTEARVERQREAWEDQRGGFSNLGDFASVVAAANSGRAHDGLAHLQGWQTHAAASGMNQGVGAEGGFTVPPEFSTAIWDGMSQMSESLLGATDQYTVTGESLTFNANAETSRATGSRYGGVRGYWIAEADQMTSSKPALRQMKLEPQQLAVFCYATDKLLANSATALTQYLTRAASEEIAFMTGDAIINGDGAGKPKGILQSGCLVSVAKETGQAAATVVTENLVKMWARMHPRSESNAVWYINAALRSQLPLLNVGVGTAGVLTYMPPGGLSGSPYATLMGRPVIPLEYCQAPGTVGDVLLADMSAYATATRGGVDTAASIHLRFDYNETAFRFLFSVDGQPWLTSAITPFKGSSTLSPFVALAARS